MNAFYERLAHFAEIIEHVSRNEKINLADHFTVVHPSYPVVSNTKRLVPKIHFEENCPKPVRQKIRMILRKAFNRIKNKL